MSWVAHVLQVLLLHGGLIGGGIDVVDGLLIEHGGAVHALDDLAGGLALPEAGDGDVLAGLQICLLNRGLKRIRLYLDGQLHGAVFFFLYVGDLHEFFLLRSAAAPYTFETIFYQIQAGLTSPNFVFSQEFFAKPCLKNVNQPRQRAFSRHAALIFLAIHKGLLRQIALPGGKIPRCWTHFQFLNKA